MNSKSIQSVSLSIFFILYAQIAFSDSQQLITTDSSHCSPNDGITTSISDGTSQAVIDTSIPSWQALGFTVGPVAPDEDILTCTRKSPDPEQILTPEQQSLDLTASIATIAINASIIQSTNIFTRLAAFREDAFLSKKKKKTNRIGASADDNPLLDQKLGFFINGNGNFGDQIATRRSNGFDFDTQGVTIGSDYRLTDNFVMGSAFGYTATHTDMNNGTGNLEADTYSLSLFGGYFLPNSFYVDGLARVGWNNYDGQRNINAVGLPASAMSNYSGNDYAVSLSAGFTHSMGALNLNPFVRYDYIHNDIDGYQEKGGPTFSNNIEEQHIDSMRSAIGAEINYVVSTPYGVLIPMMRAEWQHEFMNDSRLLTSFQSASPDLITQLYTNSPDRDFMNLGFGMSAQLPNGISGFFYYETMLANHLVTSHTFNAGVRIEF